MFTEDDYANAAAALDCDVPAVKAVAAVESSGQTHWSNGQVPILFESQWFGKLTLYMFNTSNPTISTRAQNRALYKGGPAEYGRLAEAMALDTAAALQSASWGAFQIMGFHYASLGYATPQDFVDSMQTAAGQLDNFVRFIKHDPAIHRALQQHDWEDFAARYNGPGAVDTYAPKIKAAYERAGGA